MIHESGNIPSSKWYNKHGVCTKWNAFIEDGWGEETTNKRRKRIILRPGYLSLGVKGTAKVFIVQMPLLFLGDGEGQSE